MLRILALVPLLAAGVDLTRAQVLCGSDAQTCLEAAGRGWLGTFGIAFVLLTALAGGHAAVRRRAPAAEPSGRAWLFATLALALRTLDRVAELVAGAARALPRPVARLLGIKPAPEPVFVAVDGTRRQTPPPR